MIHSLRPRLIAFAVLSIGAALAAAWLVMGALFDHYVEQRMAQSLVRDGSALQSAIAIDEAGRPAVDQAMLDPDFRRAGSGYYWEVRAGRVTLRSPSLERGALAPARRFHEPVEGWREAEIPGPQDTDLVLVERKLSISGTNVLVRIAGDDEPIDRATASFSREMAIFLVVLGAALSLGAWFQVSMGLRPLKRIRDELAAMERNPAERLSDRHPREIAAVAQAINALADARSEDLVRARRRAADLAHGLKTPLAALAAQGRAARASGAFAAADAIEHTLASAAAVLEAELARARAAASRAGEGVLPTPIASAIEGLFAVLERTDHARDVAFALDVPADWRIRVDRGSFAEIFGNILDNAVHHARRLVRVVGSATATAIEISVEDDGPGIPEPERTRVLGRGVRLDESAGGHGLGLAIVADLVGATGGSLMLADGRDRGLKVTISWPLSLLFEPRTPSEEDGKEAARWLWGLWKGASTGPFLASPGLAREPADPLPRERRAGAPVPHPS